MGEASHGTHEYYTWRAVLSKKLIQEQGFNFIAVEGDWPDCYKINRYIKGYPNAGTNILEILRTFDRWPTWMWANWEIAALAEWLKKHNAGLPPEKKVGFYGLDVYSLWESLNVLLEYLHKEDPETAKVVQRAILCFEPYQEEGQHYAEAVSFLSKSCREEVLTILMEIQSKAPAYQDDREAALSAEQNAHVIVNAERYYRNMLSFDNDSWNIRDMHMMETLTRLMNFHGEKSKGIVWEHNTHIGDARATSMKKAGMINIGQLAREQYGKKNVYLIGFGSFEGKVIAANSWGTSMIEMVVPPARKGSIEEILHKDKATNQVLFFENTESNKYQDLYPHRAIGVVYHPETEVYGNYVPSVMHSRYDAFLYIDKTHALHPLHVDVDAHKMPETYPFGI